MKAKAIILSLVGIGLVYAGYRVWAKAPKAEIEIDDETGKGVARLGNSKMDFDNQVAAVLKSWNGYELVVGGPQKKYALTRNGKNISSAETITPYDGGSSWVTIKHV